MLTIEILTFLRDSANLLYDVAGGEGNVLEKNLLAPAPYEIIAEKLTAPSPLTNCP